MILILLVSCIHRSITRDVIIALDLPFKLFDSVKICIGSEVFAINMYNSSELSVPPEQLIPIGPEGISTVVLSINFKIFKMIPIQIL